MMSWSPSGLLGSSAKWSGFRTPKLVVLGHLSNVLLVRKVQTTQQVSSTQVKWSASSLLVVINGNNGTFGATTVGSGLIFIRGANVHCPDCNAEPQTETINPATISFTAATAKRAEPTKRALQVPGVTDVERVEAFKTLPLEEFYPEYTRSPKASTQAPTTTTLTRAPAIADVPARRKNKRALPPKPTEQSFQNMYVDKMNAFRERHGVMDKVVFSDQALNNSAKTSVLITDSGCSWPLHQDAAPGNFNWAFRLTDDNTSDFTKEFDVALHFWEVSPYRQTINTKHH